MKRVKDPACFTFLAYEAAPEVTPGKTAACQASCKGTRASVRRRRERHEAFKDRERLNRVEGGQGEETKRQNNSERLQGGRGWKRTSGKRKETLGKVMGKRGTKS